MEEYDWHVFELKKISDELLTSKRIEVGDNSVTVNGVEIYDDLKAANDDFTAGKFEDAGEKYGAIGASVSFGHHPHGPEVLQA